MYTCGHHRYITGGGADPVILQTPTQALTGNCGKPPVHHPQFIIACCTGWVGIDCGHDILCISVVDIHRIGPSCTSPDGHYTSKDAGGTDWCIQVFMFIRQPHFNVSCNGGDYGIPQQVNLGVETRD